MTYIKYMNKIHNTSKKIFILISLGLIAPYSFAEFDGDLDGSIIEVQHLWAEINYQQEGKNQLNNFEALSANATLLAESNPDSASAWIWSGIVKSTYAGAKGGLGALGLAKDSKADLENAIKLDETALQGSAHTSLGTLYYNVPGWPIGFGSDKKAELHLLRGLDINPEGIDSNYFYGLYLIKQRRYEDAKQALLTAHAAAPRSNRTVADAGRQAEIATALEELETK